MDRHYLHPYLGSALFIVFWVGHAALNIWGLTGVWSKTYMEYYVQGVTGSAEAASQLLYKSTFWDNVEQWNADAKAVCCSDLQWYLSASN